jgi:hypothetical protein
MGYAHQGLLTCAVQRWRLVGTSICFPVMVEPVVGDRRGRGVRTTTDRCSQALPVSQACCMDAPKRVSDEPPSQGKLPPVM